VGNLLSQEEKKLVQALHGARYLERLRALLERRLVEVDKQLRVASGDILMRAQGRAQELEALIEALTIQRE
jgi:hypothetical protein